MDPHRGRVVASREGDGERAVGARTSRRCRGVVAQGKDAGSAGDLVGGDEIAGESGVHARPQIVIECQAGPAGLLEDRAHGRLDAPPLRDRPGIEEGCACQRLVVERPPAGRHDLLAARARRRDVAGGAKRTSQRQAQVDRPARVEDARALAHVDGSLVEAYGIGPLVAEGGLLAAPTGVLERLPKCLARARGGEVVHEHRRRLRRGRRTALEHGCDAGVPGGSCRWRQLVEEDASDQRVCEAVPSRPGFVLHQDPVAHGAREVVRQGDVAEDVRQRSRVDRIVEERRNPRGTCGSRVRAARGGAR